MVKALQEAGVEVLSKTNITSAEELSRLMKGKPAIISLPGNQPIRHAIIVDSIENGMIYIRDPGPTGQGGEFAVTVDDFFEEAGFTFDGIFFVQ